MTARAALLPALALLCACARTDPPPSGVYDVVASGTRTLYSDEDDPGTTVDYAFETTAAMYVGAGVNGADLSATFSALGLPEYGQGVEYELRLFPGAFNQDTSTATLAGVFVGDETEAIGQNTIGATNAVIQFEDMDEPTNCAYYERYRLLYLYSEAAGEQFDAELDVAYDESCYKSDGTALRERYPRVIYTLTASFSPLYTPLADAGEDSP